MREDLTEAGGKTRLYVPGDLGAGMAVVLDEGQAHYLLHVLRAKSGNRVALFNGRDGEWLADISQAGKRGVTASCLKQTQPQSQTPDIWLAFAPVKKTPADYLVQKATELGASVLQPVFTRRTIVSRINQERMLANAIEAAEQSGRLSVPEIREAASFDTLLASWPKERRLYFCDEVGDARPLAEVLSEFPPPLAGGGAERSDAGEGAGSIPLPQSVFASLTPIAPSRKGRGDISAAILTGPEGGFDPEERAALRALPFVTPVTLGPRILRADTAALAALAIWQSVGGDWR
ncbi:MAG TPA: 16S rRNA (uracil(1498)-N(3))-methyltransferase [Rhizomicrobium sp.]|nr:16S rRNA (uracil(1498)-N(3))-methyltransferase [Rhizomicrobium sp.]